MKHVFKVSEKGQYQGDDCKYDCKCIQDNDKTPAGFSVTLADAMKKAKKAAPKVTQPVRIDVQSSFNEDS